MVKVIFIRDTSDGTYGTNLKCRIFTMSGNGTDYLKIQSKASSTTDADYLLWCI